MNHKNEITSELKRKLVIISHTHHHSLSNGEIVGWGPTIEEINFLSDSWDKVVHVACLKKDKPNASELPYKSSNISFVPIPEFGGQKWHQKLDILWKSPLIMYQILKATKEASHVQVRVPMGIGVFVLPMFVSMRRRRFILWVKYANNWEHVSSSLGYRFQRWFLKKNFLKCPVTINGFWPNQPQHCKSFENPCIGEADWLKGTQVRSHKNYQEPFNIVFVGRVDENKGIDLLISSIPQLNKEKISHLHIVGDGNLNQELQNQLKKHQIPFTAHGFLSKQHVFYVMEQAHFLILPSKSEGFPKVLAEGLCMGCIPIVSQVGSINHYIKHKKNGFLMESVTANALSSSIDDAINMDNEALKEMAQFGGEYLASSFSFQHYLKKLETEVFHVF
jgi:glycosyltransferase involved in cell wall biosynthesis